VELSGKVALVTGGSRGIGRGIAQTLADAGASVALTYRERADEAAAVVAALPQPGLALQADVRDRASVRAAIAATESELGPLSVLVANAGINKPTDFDQVTDEDWDEILDVNLRGPFVCAQEALPALRRAGGGSIVMIGSVSGQYGGPRTAHYAASKAGLISLAQVVARFGAKDGIRCNTVAAGLIESEMGQSGLAAPSVQAAASGIVLGRLGTPAEVANAVVFLASDASSYVTAQTLNVNGGLYF
jgi:3-oxoacyl-[acyl-carrier protein] reductase